MYKLKEDHVNRPIWIGGDNKLLLEVNNPRYRDATNFLVSIAEPISRPDFIHEYELTVHSLHAAASVGLSYDVIVKLLLEDCKNVKIPPPVSEFIELHCRSYGKAKLVLKSRKYFIETTDNTVYNEIKNLSSVKASIDKIERLKLEEQLRLKQQAE